MTDLNPYITIYLNLLLGANYTIACLEELEGTPAYRHSLKQTANKLKKELEKLTDEDLAKLWGFQDEKMYKLMGYQENILKELAVTTLEEYEVISEMIKKYKQNPTAFKAWLGVKIVENI